MALLSEHVPEHHGKLVGLIRESHVGCALHEGFLGLARGGNPRQVAFDVGGKNRNAGAREAFHQNLQCHRLAGPGGTRDQAMAIAELQRLRSDVNKLLDVGLSGQGRQQAREAFRTLGSVLGLFQLDRWDYELKPAAGQVGISGSDVRFSVRRRVSEEEIEEKIAERTEAKKKKNFKQADEIRAELNSLGITIEDKPDGTSRWKR